MEVTESVGPAQLYHYTSAEGALGILSSGSIRATMIHYMNDAKEFQYALDLAAELILDTPGPSGERHHDICRDFLVAIRRMAVYVFSLSEHRNQLSQWRAYAGGGGYAIGIDTSQLQMLCQANNATLVRCVYDLSSQRALLSPIVAEMLEAAKELAPDANWLELYDTFAARFTSVAATIKHPSFYEEDEWRVVSSIGVPQSTVKYRSAGGLIVPYCEWSLRHGNLYPVAAVVVGPTVSDQLASRSLHHLTVGSFGWPVKVEFSDSPLRPLR